MSDSVADGGELSRRQALRLIAASAALLVGCGGPAPAAQPSGTTAPPTSAARPAATAPAAAAANAGTTSPGSQLVVAVNAWATETPFAWKTVLAEKTLWDVMGEQLIMREPGTFNPVPGLATAWDHSPDYKVWTFKLRQNVMFHGTWGEFTSDDVKFTVEQNLRPDATGGDSAFFKQQLASVDTPDKYTVVMNFKNPVWEVPSHFSQATGFQNMASMKYIQAVGEDKAAQEPIGTGPYQHVQGQQGQFHTFRAVANHWRVQPYYEQLTIRQIPEPTTAFAALRSGELDVMPISGDLIDQAKAAGFAIHESQDAYMYWAVLPGQTAPDKPDYAPQLPWVGDPNNQSSLDRAKQVRLALNMAVNKQAIYDAIYRGYGGSDSYSYFYFPFNAGYNKAWAAPAYDVNRARKTLADAGYPQGFTLNLNVANWVADGADLTQAVAQDLAKVGVEVNLSSLSQSTFLPKYVARNTGGTGWVNAPPPADEPGLLWNRNITTRGALFALAEGPFDKPVADIIAELDKTKRDQLSATLGQQLYDDYRAVMLGLKSSLWAVSKKVGAWPTVPYYLWQTNVENIRP